MAARNVPPAVGLGTRLPDSIQNGAFGTQNPAAPGRARPKPVILRPVPSQTANQLSAPNVDPDVANAIQSIQSDVATALTYSRSTPFSDGSMLENVAVKAGVNVIPHGLGRAYRGYFIGKVIGPGGVISFTLFDDVNTSPNLLAVQISIYASAAGVMDLWVY